MSSIFTCEYSVIPIYVATRIFQSNFDQNNELSKLITSYDPKKYCLQGKHLELGTTMSIFSHDLKQIFNDSHLDYDTFKNKYNIEG